MAGLDIVVDADFTSILGFDPPISDGLTLFYIPGLLGFSTEDLSGNNHDAVTALVTQSDWFIEPATEPSGTVTSYLDTLIFGATAPKTPMTLVGVGYNGINFGGYGGGSAANSTFSMNVNASGKFHCQQPTGNVGSSPEISLDGTYSSKFEFYAAWGDWQGNGIAASRKLYYGRGGVISTATASGTGGSQATVSTIPYRSPDTGVNGMARKVAHLAMYDRKLTDNEVAAHHEWAIAYFEGRLGADYGL